jgi:hypothetical protein
MVPLCLTIGLPGCIYSFMMCGRPSVRAGGTVGRPCQNTLNSSPGLQNLNRLIPNQCRGPLPRHREEFQGLQSLAPANRPALMNNILLAVR